MHAQPPQVQPALPTHRRHRSGTWVPWSLGAVALILVGGSLALVRDGGADGGADDDVSSISSADLGDPQVDTGTVGNEAQAAVNRPPDPRRPRGTAQETAEHYLAVMAFSRQGLIKQLSFEGHSREESVRAIQVLKPDWDLQAAQSAQNYLDYSPFSRQGLIDQLKFEGFTQAQAEYGVNAAGL